MRKGIQCIFWFVSGRGPGWMSAFLIAALSAGCGDSEKLEADGKAEEGEVALETAHFDWPLFRGDSEMQGVSEEILVPPLSLAWTYEPPGTEGQRLPPIDASPVIAGGVVYVGTQSGDFLALNLETGEPVWTFDAEGPIEAPAAAFEETVYFGDTFGFVYALRVSDGEEIWRYETEGKIEGGVNFLPDADGRPNVFVGSHDYFLYCLDGGTGEVIWKHETGNYVVATPSLVTSGGEPAVAFGGCDGLLYVIPADGSGDSREVEIGSYIANTSAVKDGIAYVAHNGGEVIAIELSSGEEVWRVKTGTEYVASPAVDAKSVYVAGPDKRLVSYDRITGEENWAFLARRSLDSSPLVSGEVVWQAAMDGRVYAVDRSNGTELWNYELGTRVKASPAASRGTLVICGSDGVVYAFKQ